MDAAQTLKKISFLFATALLLTASKQAAAQPTLAVTGTTVSIGSASCNNSANLTVSSSDSSNQQFSVAVQYPAGNLLGNWLYAKLFDGTASTSTNSPFSTQTGTAGVALVLGLNYGLAANSPMATVVLTPANGTAAVSITVFYTQNAGCGGSLGTTNNYISVAPSVINLSTATNGQQSQTVSIQNNSGGPYVISPTVAGGPWLSLTVSSVAITQNGTTTITVTGDATKTAGVGSYNGSLIIAAGTGYPGATLNIPVTLVVGNGTSTGPGGNSSGTLTIAGPTNTTYITAFTYVAPVAPGGQCVAIQDSAAGASSYTTQVTTNGGGNWLLANNQINTNTIQLLAPQYGACVNLSITNLTMGSGAYQGSVLITSSSGAQATINVNLYVSAGGATGVTVSPGLVSVFPNVAVGSNQVQQQGFTVTAAAGYSLGTASLVSGSTNFSISAPSANNSVESFTVTSNSTGLIAGVYAAVITVSSTINNTTSTTTITVVLPVGQGVASNPGGGGSTTVAPTSLQFQQQLGNGFFTGGQEAQSVTVTGAQGTQWSANVVYAPGGSNWLGFGASGSNGTFGSGPATLNVDLVNPTNLAPSSTPYQATVNINTTNGAYTVAVTLLVTPANTAVLLALPASATFNANTGVNVPAQSVQVVGSDAPTSTTLPPIAVGTPTATWVTATTSGNTMTISVNPSGQNSGVYSATIPVTASAYANALNYPVVMVVNGGGSGSSGPLTLSTSALSYTSVTASISQNVTVSSGSSLSVTATSQETTCTSQTWLSLNLTTFTALPAGTMLGVTVNPSGIANGTTCSGSISLVTSSGTQTISVSMTVGTASGSGNVTVNPTSLTFNYVQNQTVPPAQNVTIINASSGTGTIPLTITTAETTGTNIAWLQIGATSATTPYNNPGLAVSVAPGNLGPGQYTGTVTITPSGGAAQTVSVTMNVSNTPVVTATPTTLSLTYTVGQTSPTSTISVSAGGATAAFTATSTSNGGWLAVSPSSGTTPNTGTANLTVSLVASALATLQPSSTPYTGTITVAGTSPATGTTNTNVSLTVSAPLPTIASVNNAASGATGAVSPGELISIFAPASGANPIGPVAAVKLDSTTCPGTCTQVPVTMGGVQVKFLPSGIFAPLLYVSSSQINAVVPYEVATQGSSLSVEVLYLGQSSNAFPLTLSATAPGLFASNGAGQAAAYQLDTQGNFSYNTTATPAKVGWTIVLYVTGEGVVTPAAATGSVTVAKNTNPPTPVPAVAPTVLVGTQPATVSYGEAPSVVSGVLQINVTVPAGAGTGAVPIVVSFGTASTQTGVTVALQ